MSTRSCDAIRSCFHIVDAVAFEPVRRALAETDWTGRGHCAGRQPRCAYADAMGLDRGNDGLLDACVLRQAKVVAAAEICVAVAQMFVVAAGQGHVFVSSVGAGFG